MTDTQKLFKTFDFIVDKINQFRIQNPLEWNNEGFKLNEEKDIKSLIIETDYYRIGFLLDYEVGHQLILVLSRECYTFQYKLYSWNNSFEGIKVTSGTLKDLYEDHPLFRKPLVFLVKMGILETNTFKFKGYKND